MTKARKDVLKQFMRLQALLHRSQTQSFMNFGPWGSPQRGQGRVLSILKMKPVIAQKELAYLLDMSKQSLAELLSKLEKSGLIKREPSEEDHRSYNIRLTEEGAAVADHMDDTLPELERMFDCLSEDELANLNNYLARIIERFEAQFTGDDDDLCKQMMERFMGSYSRHSKDHGNSFAGYNFPGFFGGRFPNCWGGRSDEDEDKN